MRDEAWLAEHRKIYHPEQEPQEEQIMEGINIGPTEIPVTLQNVPYIIMVTDDELGWQVVTAEGHPTPMTHVVATIGHAIEVLVSQHMMLLGDSPDEVVRRAVKELRQERTRLQRTYNPLWLD
jgi:hypothetical protein